MDQQMPTNANEILAQATPEQARWVAARLTARSDKEAAKRAGVHPSTVSKWPNKGDLDQAVRQLLSQQTVAAAFILSQAAARAARVLTDSLNDKRQRVQAANSILDRQGVTGEQKISVTIFDLEEWKRQRRERLADVEQMDE